MHPTLMLVNEELAQLVVSLKVIRSNEPFSVAHGGWNIPGTTRDELVEAVDRLLSLIADRGTDQLTSNEALIADYPRRLNFLRANTVPQLWSGNAAQAVPAFMITIQALRDAIEKTLPESEGLTEAIAQERANAKTAATRLRALEARIADLEPRSTSLAEMVDRIEKANAAADQLPVDLQALREARKTISESLAAVTLDRGKVGVFTTAADADKATLSARVKEAEDIVARCDSAYAASTSHGLAAAFTERSGALAKSMWVWVAGLVVALGLGSWIGSTQLRNFSEIIKQPGSNPTGAFIDLVLALLSVGATVWFSWLATKQIGQRFRLAEDYAFKASVSRAYEGYRREAANIDEEFVSRLFSSALSRLDEQPLRLVETTTHGSPWHELASSGLIKKAAALVPDFTASVTQMAKDSLAALRSAGKTTPVVTISKEISPSSH
ncbi:hypothetical protein [Polaromonas sp. C04]|uniref:hypothetical protein n=1 Tax=Polaromonas sp. C04 TaxID=1945857 RepID=UPI0009CECFFA|nr:hypothetical protein [Polaromonas sp. C04]OOG53467.1 hypothetical protein B0E49_10575 [Polaromonas sp. C04]